MKRIVVGMDGSAPARDALRWAAQLAKATDARIDVVNAFVPVQSEMRPGYLERLRSGQAELCEQWCGDALDGIPCTVAVVDGDPRQVLPRALRRFDADLLVVASRGVASRGPGFLHVGSVAEYLAHHLERPLAVVAPGAPARISHVVIGVDGSAHGSSAVRWTAAIARATEASVTAVAVTEAGHPISTLTDDEADWQRVGLAILTTAWAEPLTHLGDRFHALVSREGPVADTILESARRRDADLVVVGARGVGGMTGLRIGGTALAILHRSDRTVVLVPSEVLDDDSREAG